MSKKEIILFISQPGVIAQPGVAFQQPHYWAFPLGSNPAEAVTAPYSDAASHGQNQAQVQVIMHEYITVKC